MSQTRSPSSLVSWLPPAAACRSVIDPPTYLGRAGTARSVPICWSPSSNKALGYVVTMWPKGFLCAILLLLSRGRGLVCASMHGLDASSMTRRARAFSPRAGYLIVTDLLGLPRFQFSTSFLRSYPALLFCVSGLATICHWVPALYAVVSTQSAVPIRLTIRSHRLSV